MAKNSIMHPELYQTVFKTGNNIHMEGLMQVAGQLSSCFLN
jgi:hypothetical protein